MFTQHGMKVHYNNRGEIKEKMLDWVMLKILFNMRWMSKHFLFKSFNDIFIFFSC